MTEKLTKSPDYVPFASSNQAFWVARSIQQNAFTFKKITYFSSISPLKLTGIFWFMEDIIGCVIPWHYRIFEALIPAVSQKTAFWNVFSKLQTPRGFNGKEKSKSFILKWLLSCIPQGGSQKYSHGSLRLVQFSFQTMTKKEQIVVVIFTVSHIFFVYKSTFSQGLVHCLKDFG